LPVKRSSRLPGCLVAMTFAEGAHTLLRLLAALCAIIATVRVVGAIARRFGQPAVIGELVGGILLGPTLLGRLAPEVAAGLFTASVLPLLTALGSLGVVLYMFFIGLELDLQDLRRLGPTTMAVSQAGIIVPFALGIALAHWLYAGYAGPGTSFAVFALFVGISLSVTAFPVLARILSDRLMHRTPLGVMALSAAAVEDAMAWCLLAVVVGLAQSAARSAIVTVALTVAFVGIVLFVAGPIVRRVLGRLNRDTPTTFFALGLVLAALLLSAAAAEVIGIHAVFGAFLFGAVIPAHFRISSDLEERLEGIVFVLLLPVFFATVGMSVDLWALAAPSSWLVLGVILLAACAGKLGGTMAAARVMGVRWRDAAALGVLMNTRGLVELIVLDIGRRLGILSFELFTMLVITALVTTFMTNPLLDVIIGRPDKANDGRPRPCPRSSAP
jgi:Kef-type K+ transport system membrane component KefB